MKAFILSGLFEADAQQCAAVTIRFSDKMVPPHINAPKLILTIHGHEFSIASTPFIIRSFFLQLRLGGILYRTGWVVVVAAVVPRVLPVIPVGVVTVVVVVVTIGSVAHFHFEMSRVLPFQWFSNLNGNKMSHFCYFFLKKVTLISKCYRLFGKYGKIVLNG